MDPLRPFHVAYTLGRAGLLRPGRPDHTVRIIAAIRRWGPVGAGSKITAIRYPSETGLVDDLGSLTFEQLHERSNALAHAWADSGLSEGDGVAILCRNHRGFVDASLASSKLGLRALYLNTDFAGPQIADVVERENPRAIVFDQEYAGLIGEAGHGRERFLGWVDEPATAADPLLEDLIATGDHSDPVPPSEPGSIVMLTSGTTGTPKGAPRQQPRSFGSAAGLFSKVPLRTRESTLVAAPLFHALGFAHFTLAVGLSSKLVLQRRFDPERTLRLVAQEGCTGLIVVPIMLQRILDLGDEVIDRYDLSRLRILFSAGSALAPELCVRAMDTFGEVLYNLYGSTEVAWASIATPEDLRAAPGTAGRPPRGTKVRILDDDGRARPAGQTGRIFVSNEMQFEGYSGGGTKEVIDGLMSSGDVGHLGEHGRLFVEGRDDDMIVSGGENVFPQEVEELLATHDAISEAAVVGIPDEEFGQRLRAFVVPTDGRAVDEREIKAFVRDNLARYKVPRDVVSVDELPRNPLGKVLRRELAGR